MRVFMVTDTGVVLLSEELQVKAVIIPFVRDIVQFEIDQRFDQYEPHFHYTVRHE